MRTERGSAVIEGIVALTFLMMLAMAVGRLWAVVLNAMTAIMTETTR